MRRRRTRPALLVAVAAALFAASVTVFGAGNGAADSGDPIADSGKLLADPVSPNGSRIVASRVDGRSLTMLVHSAAMDENITVRVQRPRDASQPRPVLYLVNGAGGGTDAATWWANTDVGDFLATKDVNVVMPVGGAYAYYTDWKRDDPVLGRNKWRTFFLEELPPLVDGALGTNGINAIAANSMTATAILQMAEAAPGFYRSVAGYSGCAQIADPVGRQFTKLVVELYGGGDVRNMYGEDDDPAWVANDPVVNAEALRGTRLFVSTGNGLPGQWDTVDGDYALPGPQGLANQLLVGGVIEAATGWCTRNLQDRLDQLRIPATSTTRRRARTPGVTGAMRSTGLGRSSPKDSEYPSSARFRSEVSADRIAGAPGPQRPALGRSSHHLDRVPEGHWGRSGLSLR